MAVTIERVQTSGTFSFDGADFEVENNVWLVGVPGAGGWVVVDAAHDAGLILEALDGRPVVEIVCTHGHNDHISAAVDLAGATGAPVALHPADRMLWDQVHPGRAPDRELADGDMVEVPTAEALTVLHTPGHSPGGVCLHLADEEVVFSGDTLFRGGPGATGRSFSDFPTIMDSIRRRLLTLAPATTVHTGHGESTTIAAEAPHLDEWARRGH